jgi:hypothetical protein
MSEKQYTPYFQNPLFEHAGKVCENCDKMYECSSKNSSESCKKMKEAIHKFNETCPANAKPISGGACARLDKNGKLGAKIQGVCHVGYSWSAADGKCISHVD